ncbi:DUF2927 domain-containing protein [Roseovarius aestuarii]|uniref:ATP-dependent transcriptional regulator n=1 Tax=Roseovarius aestuarii TaxID=475083 RepID=A0A1X7BVC8_9RHOB|nr:DUF2927 domain-containing protein [Roseovarius aestuarii]SMC13199.1 hypothetical protein ROA7745_03040 [Roseovarius aestuarii]
MRLLAVSLCLMLGACAAAPVRDTPTRAATGSPVTLPAMKGFSTSRPTPPSRSNRDIQRDFLDLAFTLESGRALPVFTRFEHPITVRVTGSPPPTLIPDLNRLIGRLRSEAGINIRRSTKPSANITIQAVTRAQIQRYLPKAACFVVPNISSLSEYRSARFRGASSWSQLRTREKLAIFLPNDASPQEARDCLHEELAQAIGPLNDLYRLPDSVFNDDNVHTVLTGFDMLILRIHYAPELRSGMTRDQVAARLPAILSRLNPSGNHRAPTYPPATPRAWVSAIQTALGPGAGERRRLSAAQTAVRIATTRGWHDHRRAFSHFALGRILRNSNPEAARQQFMTAEQFYRRMPGTALHRAHSAAHLAAASISRGDGRRALAFVQPHLATAKRHENAALLANLLLLQADAYDLLGRRNEARATRLDSLGWARYGFGADWVVRAKRRKLTVVGAGN